MNQSQQAAASFESWFAQYSFAHRCRPAYMADAWEAGHAAALASSPQPAAMDQGFHDGYAKGFDDGKAAASPPSAPAEVPWTMPADSQEMFSLVNKTPLLQSLLYDLNLLPEQIRTTKHWFYFQSICAHFKMAASPSAPAQVPALTVEQIAGIVREHLTALYCCTRVWEAWSVGTMSKDDFVPAGDTEFADDLAAAIVAAMPVSAPTVGKEQA